MTAVRYLAVATLGVLVGWLALQPVTVPVSVAVDSPVVRMPIPAGLFDRLANPPAATAVVGVSPSDAAVEGRGDRLRPGQRLFAKLIRKRVADRLQHDGFTLVGGNKTPLTAEQTAVLLANLDDAEIIGAAQSSGAIGDGSVMDRLGALIDWILAHREEIMSVIKFILQLLLLFADAPTS
jgi:hypothetical protein